MSTLDFGRSECHMRLCDEISLYGLFVSTLCESRKDHTYLGTDRNPEEATSTSTRTSLVHINSCSLLCSQLLRSKKTTLRAERPQVERPLKWAIKGNQIELYKQHHFKQGLTPLQSEASKLSKQGNVSRKIHAY